MFSTMKKVTAVAFVAAGALSIVGAPSAQAHVDGCSSGAVCVYPQGAGSPEVEYFRRGSHNLVNQFGVHRVFNNQSPGWTFRLCRGYNGVSCGNQVGPGQSTYPDLTPINSILIEPPTGKTCVPKCE